MRCNLILLGLIYTMTLAANPGDSIRMEERDGNYFIVHQVDQGETMYSISRRYNLDAQVIIERNNIRNNDIKLGQFLEIPFSTDSEENQFHIVKKGETLFSIARSYDVGVDDIRQWNDLSSNQLSIGQEIIVGEPEDTDEVTQGGQSDLVEDEEIQQYEYFVQTGETMSSIASKFKVTEDSIRIWNNLSSSELDIGQKIIFPFEISPDSIASISKVEKYSTTSYGSKIQTKEEGGITKVYEQGIARKIDTSMDTQKYLALHRKLKVGSVLQVKNLMNNEMIYVRIVGKLPDTGINKNVMVRLTPIAFKRLGIVDERSLVEINYFKN